MAWRINNVHFIAPGAKVSMRFWWGNGTDMGPQWAMAHPVAAEADVPLVIERVAKKLICEIGQVTINGDARYGCGGTGTDYEYVVWITNDGQEACRFQLEGGRVS